MQFRRELAEKILRGEKTATRRRMSDNPRSPWYREKCAYEVGQVFAVQPGRGVPSIGKARVTAVYLRTLGNTTEADARKEGFRGAAPDESAKEHFIAAWCEINGFFDTAEFVWVIEFALVGGGRIVASRLRGSQIETLRLAAVYGLTPKKVAEEFGITPYSAERRLNRLAARGYLLGELDGSAFWLTDAGEKSLDEAPSTGGERQ
jgi:hypothetical protein